MRRPDDVLASGQDLERLLDRRRLRFPDDLERVYLDDYPERWRVTNRVAWIFGLVTWTAFGIVDLLATSGSLREVWFLRFVLGVPAGIVAVVLTYTDASRRLMQPVTASVVFIFGALIVAMEIVLGPSEVGYHLYVFGLAPVTAFGYAAPRLRFWYATTTGWAIWVSAFAVGFDHHVWSARDPAIEFSVILALLAAVNVSGMIGSYLMEAGSRRGFLQQLIARRERDRSDLLLLNILPASVADRLKDGQDVAEAFDEATVIFADLVGFTPFAEIRTPNELMQVLNDIFSRFDAIADRHGLEKIKTIGDCYMAACGVPDPCLDHAGRAAEMALDLQEAMSSLRRGSAWPFELRVGMNTGPVMAGVIGHRKFAYDLWGATVNMASRMQTHAPPGEIRVTSAAYQRLSDAYLFAGPHAIEVKGKGEMATYQLLGRRPGRSDASSTRVLLRGR